MIINIWASQVALVVKNPSAKWISKLWYIYTIKYYSVIKKNTFESVLMMWMRLEPIIQSEVSQKEKGRYRMLLLLLLLSHFSRVQLCATPWTTALQASLSITNSQSLLKLTSIESVMPSNHLILCRPFLLLPSIFPGIRVFSNKSVLRIRWPKYWSFSFSISPSNEYSGLVSFRVD